MSEQQMSMVKAYRRSPALTAATSGNARQRAIKIETEYHTMITGELAAHPFAEQIFRFVDVLNVKASALLTHVSIMIDYNVILTVSAK